jgi:arylsulfatase A-like enzyme
VPGLLLCNRALENDHPRILDLAPTILDLFGVDVPRHMDGRPLTVADAGRSVSAPTRQEQSA